MRRVQLPSPPVCCLSEACLTIPRSMLLTVSSPLAHIRFPWHRLGNPSVQAGLGHTQGCSATPTRGNQTIFLAYQQDGRSCFNGSSPSPPFELIRGPKEATCQAMPPSLSISLLDRENTPSKFVSAPDVLGATGWSPASRPPHNRRSLSPRGEKI